jgi:outer membrane protein assembly factor BamA
MTTNARSGAFLACALLGTTASAFVALPVAAQAQSTASYTLNKVTFEGTAQVPTAELQAALPFQVGQKIDHAALQANMNAVQAVYQKHNVGAGITQRMTVFHKTRADIAYVFEEKAPVAPTVTHVGITADSVAVSGNIKVKTADILAAAGIKPGDSLTNEKIQAAQTAIVALYKKANIGSSISTDWTNAAQAQHVNLVFKVVEKSSD